MRSFKCILQCMQSASQILVVLAHKGQKPDDHVAGLQLRDEMQWMFIAQVPTFIAVQVPDWHIV